MSTPRRLTHLAAWSLACALVASSCTAAPLPTQAPSIAGETPQPGGRVVLASLGTTRSLQPVLPLSETASLIYLGLLRNDPYTGALSPELADTFSLSADGLTATYRLREGVVWSDGSPITGEDYRYAVHAVARSKATLAKARFQDVVGWRDYVEGRTTAVAGIEVTPDGRTITVRLTRVLCAALNSLASAFPPLPRQRFVAYWDDRTTDVTKNIDQNPLNDAPPVSSGPFVVKQFVPDVQTVLAPNDRYWRGRPLIDELVFKVYSNAAAVLAAILTNEVQMATAAPEDIEQIRKSAPGYELHQLPGVGSYTFFGWNEVSSRAPWLRDVRVRQALAYGIDVDSIIRSTLLGYGHRVYAHTPEASWAYDGTGLNTYPYDAAKAKQLLESAGARIGPNGVYLWTDGRPMRMTLKTNSGNKTRETIVQIAQEQYARISLGVDPDLLSFPALTALLNDHGTDFEGVLVGWSLGVENPGTYSIWHSSQSAKGGQNFIAFGDPDVDRFAEAGRSGPDCSRQARKSAFSGADKILNAQVPYTFLFTNDSIVFSEGSLRAVQPTAFDIYSYWNVERWWLKR